MSGFQKLREARFQTPDTDAPPESPELIRPHRLARALFYRLEGTL